MGAPILCLDFDGVIHSYDRGWQDGVIYGELTPGFVDWLTVAGPLFRITVYSSRSKTPEGIVAMMAWMFAKMTDAIGEDAADKLMGYVSFSHEKPPAFLTIDDRALQFSGRWEDFEPAQLLEFRPWQVQRHAG